LPTLFFRTAWRVFGTSRAPFILSVIALFASWVALELTVVALYGFGVIVNLALHLGFAVFFSGLLVGLNAMALQALTGRDIRFPQVAALMGRGPSFLGALLIYIPAVACGLLLLVVPGIYVAVRYSLFPQVLATRAASPVGALREAATLADGHWWRLFKVQAAALLVNIAGAALLGIGLLVAGPVTILATSGLYRYLLRQQSAGVDTTVPGMLASATQAGNAPFL
jgi:hypothetical protein